MDVAAWNALLDNTYGATRGPHTPAAFEVALLATSDPASEIATTTEVDDGDGGTEPVANGYARPTIGAGDWAPAADAVKASTFAPDFGTPTEAWETARFWALIDPTTDAVWNVVPLLDPLTVTGAGSPVTVQLNIAAGGVFEG